MPSVASSVLAGTGGTASASEKDFKYRDILSVARAETTLKGVPDSQPGVHTTLTTTTIEGLDVRGILTADRIVAKMFARHFMDGTEAEMSFEGSEIDNLRIGQKTVNITYHDPLRSQWKTFKEAKHNHRQLFPNRADPGDTVPWTIVSQVTAPSDTTVNGHCVYIPDFGTIYLGEVIIKDGHRKITMMRLALGSPVEGDVTIADGDGNGQPINP
jgi:hypothetical protein